MILLLDIGNTRIKWARLERAALSAQSAAPHESWTPQNFVDSILASGPRASRVLVGNVAGERMRDLARAAISQTWGIEPQFVQPAAQAGGVRNAYSDPAKLGIDRWLAIIGAHALERGALCVVSVGTAMTIDAVNAAGVHLGGVIVPGPDLMVGSLLRNTSDIAQRAQQGSTKPSLFADNTLGAIHQGAVHALAALVERAVETIRRDLNEQPALLLTGGASARIEDTLAAPHRVVPDLVLRGLAVLAR